MHDRTPVNRRRTPLLAVLAAVTLLVPAWRQLHAARGVDLVDTVDMEVAGRDVVVGTIRPAEERETFQITLPRGAKIKATVKGTGPAAPQAVVDITDPDGALLGSSGPAKAAKTPQIATTESGVHHLLVCGDGELDGDYRLSVKAKMPRSAAASSAADVAPGAEGQATFGAGAGATATITVSAAGKSGFVPTILDITGPDDVVIPVEPPAKAGKRHVVRDVLLSACGDYTVRFRNDGATAGGWTARIRLKTPKAVKSTIEITDDVLGGEFGGEQAVFARVIDAAGGTVAPDDGDLDLFGVSVVVPAGAVTAPTLFTIADSEEFFVDDDLHEGGATFELGPSGIPFTEDVVVTVPFDPQSFDDPQSEVQVAIRDGDTGEVQVVTGTVDVDAGTVTFTTPHFSGFQPVSPRPRPLVGGFVELELGARLDEGYGGALLMGLNGLVGQPGPRSGNVVVRTTDRRSVSFGPDGQAGFTFDAARDQGVESGTVLADTDLTLRIGNDDIVYKRGRSSDVLVRTEAQNGQALTSLLLRRVAGRATQGALRGTWHAIVFEQLGERASTGPLRLSSAGQRFELEVSPDGRAVASSSDLWVTGIEHPGGRRISERIRKPPPPGSLTADGAYARLELAVGAGGAPGVIDLHPVARGDLLIGVTGDYEGSVGTPRRVMSRLVLLVRAGTGGDDSVLNGRSQLVSIDLSFASASIAQVPIPVIDLLRVDVQHDGLGALRERGFDMISRHGPGGTPSVTIDPVDVAGTYHVAGDLSYRETGLFGDGAVLRRQGLYVVTAFGPDRVALGFGLVSRPADQ